MCPRIVDKEGKKRLIVESALRVFARKGFSATKMIDIAREAAIGKGTIYEYFRSKDEVFLQAFNHFMTEFDAEIGKHLFLITDPKQELDEFIRVCLGFYGKFADFTEIMFDFWAEGVRERHDRINLNEVYDKYREYIASILEDGMRSGAFRQLDTMLVASAIIGALDGLAFQWIAAKRNFPLAEAADALRQLVVKGIEADRTVGYK